MADGAPFHEDALEPSTSGGSRLSGTEDPMSPFQGMGKLLEEEDDKRIVDAIVAMLREQAPARKRRRSEWACNKLWIKGVRGARVRRRSEDRNDVELVVPLGAYDVPPVLDRTDELVEKVTSHLISDPPVPEAEPSTDSDADRDSAEFTTRLLTVEGAESGWNNLGLMRRAHKKAAVYGSTFIYAAVDAQGGGWRPMQMLAHPMAQSEQDATVDPQTGLNASPEMLRLRYVGEDGSLSDSPEGAKMQWLPALRPKVMTGEQVVLLPETCQGVHDAHGAILIDYVRLADLRAEYPEFFETADPERDRKLVDWRPEDAKHARPGADEGRAIKDGVTDDGRVKDSAEVCVLRLLFTSHGAYPKGASLCVAGGEYVLHKDVNAGVVETLDGAVEEECLMLPLAQCRQLDDDIDDDHMGRGIVSKLGPADEVRGQITLAWLEYLDRFLHFNTFLPLGSIVDPGELERRDGTPIYFNPQGKPEFEQVGSFPADGKEFFDRATRAQDSASMLEEAAQGTNNPNVKSGIHAQIEVQQAHVNMSTMRQNMADCQERWWRVVTQLYRVFWTIPAKVKLVGEDGAYKLREWTRADLGSTKDIRIARGSFTQMSPEQKQQQLDQRMQAQLIDREEYERLSANNVRPVLGFQDNPHRQRVRKAITAWREGPPEGWAEQRQQIVMQAQQQAAMQPPQVDPMGQPVPPQPPPDAANPFADVRPVDAEPDVARIRWLELRREVASDAVKSKPPEWTQHLMAAYDAARRACGVMTLAEQQQAQQMAAQQQASQQQQQQASEQAAKQTEKQDDRAHEQQQTTEQREFEQQMAESKADREQQRDAMRAQGAPMVQA